MVLNISCERNLAANLPISSNKPQLFATDLQHSNGPAGTAQSHLVRKPKNRSGKNAGHLFGQGWTRGGWWKINDCDVWVILGDFVKFGNIPPEKVWYEKLYSRRTIAKTWHDLLGFFVVFCLKDNQLLLGPRLLLHASGSNCCLDESVKA